MGDKEEKPQADQGSPASKKPLWLDVLDVSAKVLGAVFLLLVAWIGNSFQARLTGISLQSQREQAESQLRANMFSNLISPIVGPVKDGKELKTDREELLVELLALNFHDDFELKPLMEDVDHKLANGSDPPGDKSVERERESLRSIVRRVAARQIAAIQYGWAASQSATGWTFMKNRSDKASGCHIYTITFSTPNEDRDGGNAMSTNPTDQHSQEENENDGQGASPRPVDQQSPRGNTSGEQVQCTSGWEFEKTVPIYSPDGQQALKLTALNPDWTNETLDINVSVFPKETSAEREPSATYQFTLTWFDLPLTDNTLLPDGNRFAVNLQGVVRPEPKSPGFIDLRVVWFPKGYFTPRERPLDFRQVRKLIGMPGQ